MSEDVNKKHSIQSFSKTSINVIVSFCIIIVVFAIGFFVIDDYKLQLQDLNFWLQKLLLGIASYSLMICTSNIVEERLKRKDSQYIKRINAIDTHYTTLNENYETDELEKYIENINIKKKYNAYLYKTKKKLHRTKNEKKVELIEQKLIQSPLEVWQGIEKVKYKKVTYDLLVNGAIDLKEKESDTDLQVNKHKYRLQKFLWKFICIISVGLMFIDPLYHFADLSTEMIMPNIFKLLTILISIYSGVCFGYFIMEKTNIVLKRKCKIFSEFRNRKDNNIGYDVKINDDIAVEKIKEKLSLKEALKETTQETFGKGKPVKAGAFGKEVINNMIGG